MENFPTHIDLVQNYPNPFNSTTNIRLRVGQNGHYTLQIADALGRIVKSLLDQTLQSGLYDIRWNGLNDKGEAVASGIYVGILDSPEGKRIFKMMLLK